MTQSNPNATSRIINIIQTSKKGENHEVRIFKSFTNEEDETMVKLNKVVLELIELIKANKWEDEFNKAIGHAQKSNIPEIADIRISTITSRGSTICSTG